MTTENPRYFVVFKTNDNIEDCESNYSNRAIIIVHSLHFEHDHKLAKILRAQTGCSTFGTFFRVMLTKIKENYFKDFKDRAENNEITLIHIVTKTPDVSLVMKKLKVLMLCNLLEYSNHINCDLFNIDNDVDILKKLKVFNEHIKTGKIPRLCHG